MSLCVQAKRNGIRPELGKLSHSPQAEEEPSPRRAVSTLLERPDAAVQCTVRDGQIEGEATPMSSHATRSRSCGVIGSRRPAFLIAATVAVTAAWASAEWGTVLCARAIRSLSSRMASSSLSLSA